MKVVQVNAIYGRKSTGTIVREIKSCCELNGIECDVAYSIAERPGSKVPGGYQIGNKLTAKWHALMSRIWGKQAYFNHLTTWRFLRWLDRLKPDVVHLHNLHSNYIHLNMLLRYLAKRDIPTVITFHDCWYFTGGCVHYTSVGCDRWKSSCGQCPQWKELPSWFRDSTASVLKDRSRFLNAIPHLTIVGVSEWIAGQVRESVLGKKPLRVIYNGFDLDIFRPRASGIRERSGIKDRFVILGPADKWLLPVNKLTLNYFLDNLPDDAVMVLFGSSPVSVESPKIIRLGYIKGREEMAEVYSMADVFVNCSREDTLSSLNLECQACGTPVVTYDATGSKETVDNQCGFAVQTGNCQALWEKVLEVRGAGKASLSSACREFVKSRFEKSSNYMEYIDLFRNIIDA